jgi:integrase/recombinase XerD
LRGFYFPKEGNFMQQNAAYTLTFPNPRARYFSQPRGAAELFREYLEVLQMQGANNTYATYKLAYDGFLRAESDFDEDAARRFVRAEQARGVKNSSINTKLAALRACAKWAFVKGRVPANFMELIKPLPVVGRVKEAVEIDVGRLFAEIDAKCRKPWLAARNKAMFMVFMETGCRVSELTGMEWKDLRAGKGEIKVLGKGNKERFVYYSLDCAPLMDDYLRARSAQEAAGSPYLFLSGGPGADGSAPLTRQGVSDVVGRYSAFAGNAVGCHKLRHWCAANYRKRGADVYAIQKALGHAKVTTTEIYLPDDEDAKREAANRYMSGVFAGRAEG